MNNMDLVFSRKVVKPLRGGGGVPTTNYNSRDRYNSRGRDSSANRSNIMSNQMSFEQFMNNRDNSRSQVRGRASLPAVANMTPIKAAGGTAGAPLINPKFQREYTQKMIDMQGAKGAK